MFHVFLSTNHTFNRRELFVIFSPSPITIPDKGLYEKLSQT